MLTKYVTSSFIGPLSEEPCEIPFTNLDINDPVLCLYKGFNRRILHVKGAVRVPVT